MAVTRMEFMRQNIQDAFHMGATSAAQTGLVTQFTLVATLVGPDGKRYLATMSDASSWETVGMLECALADAKMEWTAARSV